AVQAPAAQIGSMTSHSESETRRPRAITNSPLATTVATFDYTCGYLSRDERVFVPRFPVQGEHAAAERIAPRCRHSPIESRVRGGYPVWDPQLAGGCLRGCPALPPGDRHP